MDIAILISGIEYADTNKKGYRCKEKYQIRGNGEKDIK